MIDTRTVIHGPLFDGRLAHRVHLAVDLAVSDVTDEGVNMLHDSASAFKNPTGNWEAKLATDRTTDGQVITDQAVYNAWLEGVSERNRASRFRGYRMWRLTAQKLQSRARFIAEQAIRRVL